LYKIEPDDVQEATFLSSAIQILLTASFPVFKLSMMVPVLTECKKISPLVLAEVITSSLLNQARLVTGAEWALTFKYGSLGFLVFQILTVLFTDPAAI
jgi:hypothetical protein